ncbi:MAG: amidohydrolase family protein [bacterium]
MSFLIRFDQSWPSTGTSEVGIEDGLLVPPDSLEDPQLIDFEGSHIVLTPGWVNAHSHLELSGCPSIDYNGNFVDWIYEVLDYKESVSTETIVRNYREGLDSLLESGVVRVVDHCDLTGSILEILDELPAGVHLLKELIAFNSDQIESIKNEAKSFIEQLKRHNQSGGLAPHAPYSAHPEVYSWAADRSSDEELALSTHLHEVKAELEFSENGNGDFLKLLRERTDGEVSSPYDGMRPLPYFLRNNVFSNSMFAVHMNYLDDQDLRWLESSRICPVFCPKSYSYFNHRTLPVLDWIERGIDFAFGTDSLASNDTLNMLSELRCFQELTDGTNPETVLEALTINPAEVLNIPSRGVLSWGTPADLSVFDVPSGDLRGLARGEAESVAVFRDGTPVWQETTV